MARTARRLPPERLLDAWVQTGGRSDDLWDELGKLTIDRIADGVRTLAQLWSSAWAEAGVSAPPAQALDRDELLADLRRPVIRALDVPARAARRRRLVSSTRGECVGELLPARVAAADDGPTRLPRSRLAQAERRRERRGAGALGQVAPARSSARCASRSRRRRPARSRRATPRGSVGAARTPSASRAPRRRLHPVLDEPPLAPRAVRRRRRIGLDADHANVGVDRRRDDAGAGRAAAAADRHDDHIGGGLILEHLQRPGAYARDQQRLVAGMDVAVACSRASDSQCSRASSKSCRGRRARPRALASPRP